MRPSGSPREAILLLALAGFNAGISLRCVEPMLPKLSAEFGVSVSAAGVVITAFALAYAVAVLLQGPLGDRFGKLRVVTVGTALAGLGALASAFAWNHQSRAAQRHPTRVFADWELRPETYIWSAKGERKRQFADRVQEIMGAPAE